MQLTPRGRGGHGGRRGPGHDHGCVVDSVNVSVFEYEPAFSGSLAAIACWN